MSFTTRDRIHRHYQNLLSEIAELGQRVLRDVEPQHSSQFERQATTLVRNLENDIRLTNHLLDHFDRLMKYRRTDPKDRDTAAQRPPLNERRRLTPPSYRPLRKRLG